MTKKEIRNRATCRYCGGSNAYGHQRGCPDYFEDKQKVVVKSERNLEEDFEFAARHTE